MTIELNERSEQQLKDAIEAFYDNQKVDNRLQAGKAIESYKGEDLIALALTVILWEMRRNYDR